MTFRAGNDNPLSFPGWFEGRIYFLHFQSVMRSCIHDGPILMLSGDGLDERLSGSVLSIGWRSRPGNRDSG